MNSFLSCKKHLLSPTLTHLQNYRVLHRQQLTSGSAVKSMEGGELSLWNPEPSIGALHHQQSIIHERILERQANATWISKAAPRILFGQYLSRPSRTYLCCGTRVIRTEIEKATTKADRHGQTSRVPPREEGGGGGYLNVNPNCNCYD